MNNKTKIFVNMSIITLILVVVLYFSLKDHFLEIISLIKNMNIFWLCIATLLFIVSKALVGLSSYYIAINNGQKIGLWKVIQINFIILFFHGITPFATGGQPMEIYYLHNSNIPLGRATNIVLLR